MGVGSVARGGEGEDAAAAVVLATVAVSALPRAGRAPSTSPPPSPFPFPFPRSPCNEPRFYCTLKAARAQLEERRHAAAAADDGARRLVRLGAREPRLNRRAAHPAVAAASAELSGVGFDAHSQANALAIVRWLKEAADSRC